MTERPLRSRKEEPQAPGWPAKHLECFMELYFVPHADGRHVQKYFSSIISIVSYKAHLSLTPCAQTVELDLKIAPITRQVAKVMRTLHGTLGSRIKPRLTLRLSNMKPSQAQSGDDSARMDGWL